MEELEIVVGFFFFVATFSIRSFIKTKNSVVEYEKKKRSEVYSNLFSTEKKSRCLFVFVRRFHLEQQQQQQQQHS